MKGMTSPATGQSNSSWKKLWREAESLMGKGGTLLYRRCVLLNKIFEDMQFRLDVGATSDRQTAKKLDELLQDVSLTFLQLREVLIRFPNESQWASGRLREMYAEVKAVAVREHTDTAPVLSRYRPTKKEIDELKAENQDLKIRCRQQAARIIELETRVKELELECAMYKRKLELSSVA